MKNLLLFIILTSLTACKKNIDFKNDTIVAIINDDPIFIEEYTIFKNSSKTVKHGFYHDKKEQVHQLEIINSKNIDFSELNILDKKTLYTAILDKLEWQLLKRKGVVEKTGYFEVLEEFETINKGRLKKKGKVIYGPIQFSLNAYLATKKSKAKIKLRHRDIENLLTKDTISTYYENNKEALFKLPKQVQLEWHFLDKKQEYTLQNLVEKSITDDSLKTIKLDNNELHTYTFQPNSSKEDRIKYPKLSALAQEMEEKSSYLLYINTNQLALVTSISVKESDYLPLKEVYHVVQNKLFDIWYNHQLNTSLAEMSIDINTRFFNKSQEQ